MRPPTFEIASLWITTVSCWIARREVDFSILAMAGFNYKPQTSYPFKTLKAFGNTFLKCMMGT
jgi:hypothetical protein